MAILVFNSGSSSIKFAVIDPSTEKYLLSGLAENINATNPQLVIENQKTPLKNNSYNSAIASIIDLIKSQQEILPSITAVGHRIVHGGEHFSDSVIITPEILTKINSCNHLAPLHNPANITTLEAAQKAFPNLPHIAVFDTGFHQTLPEHAYLYAIPYELYKKNSVRRYGFHGISHRYVSQKAAEQLNIPLTNSAFISAHLGNGCSATAILNGRSIDTSMGMTPLEGLVMGTRSGDIDPSIPAYLADELNYDIHKTTSILNKESGLLGISGLSNDMRTLSEAASQGHERAQLAINIFCYRLSKTIAALTVPLNRLDALIFTGGIGENDKSVRERVLAQLTHLNFAIDNDRNNQHGASTNGIITRDNSGNTAIVIATQEDLLIAQDTVSLIKC